LGRHEISFSRVTREGVVEPRGHVSVPLEAGERTVFERTKSPYRILMDAFFLAADGGTCAAFFQERNVFVPCSGGAPVHWKSRGSELEPLVRRYEAQHHLPPVPLPQLAQVEGFRNTWWVLERVTSFDEQTGTATGRDRVRIVARDGTLLGELALGGTAMGIGVMGDRFQALLSDGRLEPLPVEFSRR